MNILVTGGAGYIGSHTVIELMAAGHTPVVVDSLVNSSAVSLDRIAVVTGKRPVFHAVDLRDAAALDAVFQCHGIDSVIHFAGHKSIGESVAKPLDYYENNLGSTLTLLRVMEARGCSNLVFSSSATVYGNPERLPVPEDHPIGAVNPYGRTKLFAEGILRDIAASDPSWRIVILRYFNPVGAHPSGLLGEDPAGPPNNLFPCITQYLTGRRPELRVFGTDYPTRDGSGVRDYVHVMDLARGHVAAVEQMGKFSGAVEVNLGTGTGFSVLEVVKGFEEASGREIMVSREPRRPGDVAECYADTRRAAALLGWTASADLGAMCRDAWNWQLKNPYGYR